MKFTLFVLLLLPLVTLSQFGFEFQSELPVYRNNQLLNNAWAGGLNFVQFSSLDYDFDGDEDLFLFDRSNNNIRLFENVVINGVRQYKYVHDAWKMFPQGIYSRATMVDYDNDGRKDIFCYGLGGLMVYRNIGDATNGLQWELTKEIVYSSYNGILYNLAVTSTDIPAIIDVDGDGDLDVLTFHMGGSHVEYHKNLSMDNYGIPDSLHFVLMNECWGKFEENVNDNSITLDAQSYPCITGNIPNPEYPINDRPIIDASFPKHAGSTVLALDYDGNGVLDLILGDISFPNLVLLMNGGTTVNSNSSMISYDMNFPSNSSPANLHLFPAAFHVDVNFDGKRDLIIGASARNISKNTNSVWFYENIGTEQQPNFVFRTNEFLQNTMIDHGRGSVPLLVDVDRDGLTDLIVANFYTVKDNGDYESKMVYYKNTGTATSPTYTYMDGDWLNISNTNLGLRVIPTFGDLNGDGIRDMVIGKGDGRLTFSVGTSNSFSLSTASIVDESNQIISVGSFAHPQLFDVNNDGLLDLVIGNALGKIYYYQNVGTPTNYKFRLITDQFGGIVLENNGNSLGYAAPHLFRTNGMTHFFIGHSEGSLVYARLNIGDEHLPFEVIDNDYLGLKVEGYSSFFVQDIDGDGNLNMFVGLDLGGLMHFEANPDSDLTLQGLKEDVNFELYPNPSANGVYKIQYRNIQILNYSIYTITGQSLKQKEQWKESTIDLSEYENGSFIIQFETSKGQIVKRIIKG